jgi:hypothetical protein
MHRIAVSDFHFRQLISVHVEPKFGDQIGLGVESRPVAGNSRPVQLETVQKLKPVSLMSPMSVADFPPPNRVRFDLVVIDEASRVRPKDALGVIARGRQLVVVGDSKQLPPTNFFRMISEDEEDENERLNTRPQDFESIQRFESRTSLPLKIAPAQTHRLHVPAEQRGGTWSWRLR